MESKHTRVKIFGQVAINQDDYKYHLCFWVVIYILHFINFAFTDIAPNYWDSMITANLTIITTSIVSYLHTYFLLPRTLGNPRLTETVALTIYLTFTFLLIFIGAEMFEMLNNTGWLGNLISQKNSRWERNLPETVFNMYLLTGLVYVRKWFHNSEELRLRNELLGKENQLLSTNKELLEKESQLNLYKLQTLNWQIKPHFLFNALNNIYIKTLRNPSTVSDAVLQFSDTMRYIVYDCLSDRVPLSSEVNFIQNYIDMSLQGLPEDVYKKEIDIGSIPENALIMPLILITFVENAVKHGIQKTDKNKWLYLKMDIENGILNFVVRNSQSTEPTGRDIQSSGKGIANTRERLKIAYPNHHQLLLNSDGDVFEVVLKIDLN